VSGEPSGLERVFFAGETRAEIDSWVAGVVRQQLGRRAQDMLFRAGRIDAVYGLRMADGSAVVLRLYRPPVDVGVLEARLEALGILTGHGYPCPQPLSGPFTVDGRTGAIETLLDQGVDEDARRPEVRRALVSSLLRHVDLLADHKALARRLSTRPAWTEYRHGPWPRPHDPIFDFSATPAGWEWVDALARRATEQIAALRAAGADLGGEVVGHGDWYAGNVRFANGEVVATFDWDLIVEDEAVLIGLTAGAFTAPEAPSPSDVTAFVQDAAAMRGGFSDAQLQAASAAARWVLAFNARCELSNLGNRSDLTEGEIAASSNLRHLRDELAGFESAQ
jgi:phosphotransferase family enzyme